MLRTFSPKRVFPLDIRVRCFKCELFRIMSCYKTGEQWIVSVSWLMHAYKPLVFAGSTYSEYWGYVSRAVPTVQQLRTLLTETTSLLVWAFPHHVMLQNRWTVDCLRIVANACLQAIGVCWEYVFWIVGVCIRGCSHSTTPYLIHRDHFTARFTKLLS